MTIGQMIQFFPRLQRGHGYGIGKRWSVKVAPGDRPPSRHCVVRGCSGGRGHTQDRVSAAERYMINDIR